MVKKRIMIVTEEKGVYDYDIDDLLSNDDDEEGEEG